MKTLDAWTAAKSIASVATTTAEVAYAAYWANDSGTRLHLAAEARGHAKSLRAHLDALEAALADDPANETLEAPAMMVAS